MANEVTSSVISELSQIAVQEFSIATKSMADLSSLCMRRQITTGQVSARFPVYTQTTATNLTEGNSFSNTAISQTAVTLTPENNGIQHAITDLAANAWPQLLIDAARLAAAAIVNLRNTQIITLFDSLTSIGTTNTNWAESTHKSGIKALQDSGAPGPYFIVGSPQTWLDISDVYGSNTNLTANYVRDAAYRGVPANGYIPVDLFGASPVVCNQFTSDGNGDIKGAIISPYCLGMAVCTLDAPGSNGNIVAFNDDVRLEIQRDASLTGFKAVFTSCYKVGIVNSNFGREYLLDN